MPLVVSFYPYGCHVRIPEQLWALGYKEPLFYNFAVAREFAKQVYVKELQPPRSVEEVRVAYSSLWKNAGNGEYWRTAFSNGDVARLAVYGAQAYGLFKVCYPKSLRSLFPHPYLCCPTT